MNILKWLKIVVLLSAPTSFADPTERMQEPEEQHGTEEEEEAAKSWVTHNKRGDAVLTLDAATQSKIGLAVEALQAVIHQPAVVAYGRLEADPGMCCTVRAALDGFLQAPPQGTWPDVGEVLADRAIVGVLQPRFTALERFELRARRVEAAAEVDALKANLDAARASFDNKKRLNTEGKVVSDRALEEAEAKLKSDEAQLNALTGKISLVDEQLSEASSPRDALGLVLPQGGEVAAVLARPGEAVASGQELLRIARFDRQIARVEIPVGERVETTVATARIVVLGHEDQILSGEIIGSPQPNDIRKQGQTWLFRVAVGDLLVRPGAALTAYLTVPGEAHHGVVIPRLAILRYSGLNWVYVQVAEDRFERRRITLLSPLDSGWFTTAGVNPGDRVVVAAPQVLLSEELKAQIEREEIAEE